MRIYKLLLLIVICVLLYCAFKNTIIIENQISKPSDSVSSCNSDNDCNNASCRKNFCE